jgi:hypothetical protein
MWIWKIYFSLSAPVQFCRKEENMQSIEGTNGTERTKMAELLDAIDELDKSVSNVIDMTNYYLGPSTGKTEPCDPKVKMQSDFQQKMEQIIDRVNILTNTLNDVAKRMTY